MSDNIHDGLLTASVSLNLGPVSLPLTNGSIVSNGNGFGYNPRCIARDLTDAINQRFANATSIVRNILAHDDIWDFQMTMQGTPGTGDIGIHGGGHYAIGGDPARDVSYYETASTYLFLTSHSSTYLLPTQSSIFTTL